MLKNQYYGKLGSDSPAASSHYIQICFTITTLLPTYKEKLRKPTSREWEAWRERPKNRIQDEIFGWSVGH
jgi:hypothetical protein